MHTIKDCSYCGQDYMYHELDRNFYAEICQVCAEKYVVIEDEQSVDNLAIILAYDYCRMNDGHKILFFGTKEQTDNFRKKVNSQIY